MRRFSAYQKKLLRICSGNKCNHCGKVLKTNFHADHIYPYSKGGKTNLNNGQALCATCNLRKSNRI